MAEAQKEQFIFFLLYLNDVIEYIDGIHLNFYSVKAPIFLTLNTCFFSYLKHILFLKKQI